MIVLGSHVSMKAPHYFLGSIEEALSYQANACMIYTGPPSNSRRVSIDQFKIEQAKELMKEYDFKMEHVIVHAPYIINIGNSLNQDTFSFGCDFLKEELHRVKKMGASILVLHPGSHVKAGKEAGLKQVIQGLNLVLEQDDSNVCIALETMAGKGSELGSTFEEIAYIRSHVFKKERIKVCLDTCHIHDAGYSLEDFDQVLQEFDEIIGLENLVVIHINDSKNMKGAHKDRHENIGQGYIGFSILHSIVHHPKLEGIPMILETPYIDGNPPYKEEIKKLTLE